MNVNANGTTNRNDRLVERILLRNVKKGTDVFKEYPSQSPTNEPREYPDHTFTSFSIEKAYLDTSESVCLEEKEEISYSRYRQTNHQTSFAESRFVRLTLEGSPDVQCSFTVPYTRSRPRQV